MTSVCKILMKIIKMKHYSAGKNVYIIKCKNIMPQNDMVAIFVD